MLRLAKERLETERLILRQPQAADAGRIAELANNKNIARHLATMPHPYAHSDAVDFITRVTAVDNPGWTFVITAKPENGALIGVCGYGYLAGQSDHLLGYWLGEAFWGCGYASEAAAAVITHAFCLSMVDWLDADYDLENPASGRVLEKLGFSAMGKRTSPCLALGHSVEVHHLQLSCDDWLQMKSSA